MASLASAARAGHDDGDALAGEAARCRRRAAGAAGAFWSGVTGHAQRQADALGAEVGGGVDAETPGAPARPRTCRSPVILACASGERTTATCSVPGGVIESV